MIAIIMYLLWIFWLPIVVTFGNAAMVLVERQPLWPVIHFVGFVVCLFVVWRLNNAHIQLLLLIVAEILGVISARVVLKTIRGPREGTQHMAISGLFAYAATGIIAGVLLSHFWKVPLP